MNSDIVSLIIILICVMLSAYFSATETSFTSLNRIRMKNMAEKGDKRAYQSRRLRPPLPVPHTSASELLFYSRYNISAKNRCLKTSKAESSPPSNR